MENRRVQVFEFDKGSIQPPRTKIPVCMGIFHGWFQHHQEFDLGPGKYTVVPAVVAIVEKDDGNVELVWPGLIKFVDDDDPLADL